MEEQALAGVRRIPGVTAVVVVDDTGVLQAGRTPVDEAQGSLLAALAGALHQTAADLGLGEMGETILEAEQGALVAGSAGGGRTVVVLAGNKSSLGMIRVELRRLRRRA